jgi:hypothetical protein
MSSELSAERRTLLAGRWFCALRTGAATEPSILMPVAGALFCPWVEVKDWRCKRSTFPLKVSTATSRLSVRRKSDSPRRS